MLQIISGKFFKSNNLITHNAKGILHSNYYWPEPINTKVGILELSETAFSPIAKSYIFSYENKIEKDPEGDIIIRVGDEEILEQFRLICILGLTSLFDFDKTALEINCRKYQRSLHDRFIPSKFIPQFFEESSGKINEIKSFIKLVEQIIGLPREIYLSVINSLKAFSNALQVINYDMDLAYSMLVYTIESLCQKHSYYETSWDDYDENVKKQIDRIIENNDIKEFAANDIRKVLYNSGDIKLKKRFVEFSINHLDDSFFKEGAADKTCALRKSSTEMVLRNAYDTRSKYVHELEPILEQLKHPAIADFEVYYWHKIPYLTFRGLTRLTQHIIYNFIYKQDCIEKEEYDWRSNLPGIMQFEVSPNIWVHRSENFQPIYSKGKLSGFLEQLASTLEYQKPLIDLTELMTKYEELIPNTTGDDLRYMCSLYFLYNYYIPKAKNMPKYDQIFEEYKSIFNECTIESILTRLLLNNEIPWNTSDCVFCYEKHFNNRFKIDHLKIPLLFELFMLVKFANMYLKNKDMENFAKYLDAATLEAAGKPKIQEIIEIHKIEKKEFDYWALIKQDKENCAPKSQGK